MRPGRRQLVRFVLQFAPFFLVLAWGYVRVLPYYGRLVVGSANAVTERLVPPTRMEMRSDGAWQYRVFTPERGVERLKSWNTPHFILLSLPLVPALLLASPATWLARVRATGVGLALVFASHVLAVVALSRGTYGLLVAPGSFFHLWLLAFVYVSGQVAGLGIWVLLTWRLWFPRPGAVAPP
jgi:hypothetical protein